MAFSLTLLYIALSLLSPAILPPEIAELHIIEILAAPVFIIALTKFSSSGLSSIPDTYMLFGLLCSTVLSGIATGWLGSIPPMLALILPPVFTFYFVVVTCRTIPRLNALIYVMTSVAFYFILRGAWANFIGDEESVYVLMEHGLTRNRGLGFLSDPNDVAQLYAILVPLLFLRWKKDSPLTNLLFTLLPATILCIGIYQTHSRGGAISLVAIALFAFKDKIGLILSAVLGGLLALALVALNMTGGRGVSDDDGGRIALWGTGLGVFKTNPILGIGMNNFVNVTDNGLTAHNSYVLCIAEQGIIGFFFWMGIIVLAWGGLSNILGKNKKAKATDPTLPVAALAPDTPHLEQAPPTPALAFPNSFAFAPASASGAPPAGFHLPAPSHSAQPFSPDFFANDVSEPIDQKTFSRYARVVQTSMVGFLVTAFFLSRTYVMTLYILLGIAVSLRLIYKSQFPDYRLSFKFFAFRTLKVMVGCILFLYAFVRIKGVGH